MKHLSNTLKRWMRNQNRPIIKKQLNRGYKNKNKENIMKFQNLLMLPLIHIFSV